MLNPCISCTRTDTDVMHKCMQWSVLVSSSCADPEILPRGCPGDICSFVCQGGPRPIFGNILK